jgi:predicted nucleotidyltransferase component of viral defense system
LSEIENHTIDEWVDLASTSENREFRQAVHTILAAISIHETLKTNMILKGGILLAIHYQSERYTKDIDFSTSNKLSNTLNENSISQALNESLTQTIEELDYGLDCVVQSSKVNPSHKDASFPSINLKIGHAYKGTPKHKRLQNKQSPTVVSIDFSLNESTPNINTLRLSDEYEILAYSLTDLIAEKYRALLQQSIRGRNRRQDIYDLYLIFSTLPKFYDDARRAIFEALLEKSKARNIQLDSTSIDNPKLKEMAKHEYQGLADEIDGELPDFERSFEVVRDFSSVFPNLMRPRY